MRLQAVALVQCLVAVVAGLHMAETVYLASPNLHLGGASMGTWMTC